MKIAKLSVFALAALAFTVGCKDKGGDSGDSGAGGADGADGGSDDGGDGGTDQTVDSCSVADWGICYEYNNYTETADWCDSLAAAYGVTTTYGPNACIGLGACSIPAGGDFTEPAEAYYDEASYDAASAEAACVAGGGTWNG